MFGAIEGARKTLPDSFLKALQNHEPESPPPRNLIRRDNGGLRMPSCDVIRDYGVLPIVSNRDNDTACEYRLLRPIRLRW